MKAEIAERIQLINKGQVPEGYKKSKKYLFPIEWKFTKLKNYEIKIGSGKTPKGGEGVYVDSGIIFIRSQNVLNSKLSLSEVAYITNETHQSMISSKVIKGDVLLNITGASIGRCCLVPIDFTEGNVNQHVCIIRTTIELDNEFLLNTLISQIGQEQIMNNQAGGNREGLNFEQIRNILIPVPPLPEQQKIASILSTWDKAIELKEKLISEKKKQKTALMQELLTGKKRLDGFDGEWEDKRLSEIFDRVVRKNSTGNTNVLTISAQRGLINQEDFFKKSVASSILDNYYLLEKGEFAYNKSYSNGYPMGAIKRLDGYDSGVVTTLYICFKLKNILESNSDFYIQYFESGLLIEPLMQIAQEGGRAHGLLNVSVKDFFQISLKVPSIQEQTAIANILSLADKEISLLEKEREALKEQKKGLMQLLLTGVVRVN